ncbi:MAG: hypothetical protein IKU26_00620, partial [Clostridia bacterium]|nr:hypothetical protein [Clostridia bacterium]
IYDVGETVRTFTLNKDDKTLLNLKDAEEIFAKRKGGPASKLVKDGTAFHLSEVLEYEPPRPSYFQNHGTYIRIYDSQFKGLSYEN